jgi:glutaredoxin
MEAISFKLLLLIYLFVLVSAGARPAPGKMGPRSKETIPRNPVAQKALDEIQTEVKNLIQGSDAIMFVEKRVCLYCVQIRSLFEKFQLPLTEIAIDEMPRLAKKHLYLQAFYEIAGIKRTPALWAGGGPVLWTQKDETKGQHSDYLQPVLEGIQRVKSRRMKRQLEESRSRDDL